MNEFVRREAVKARLRELRADSNREDRAARQRSEERGRIDVDHESGTIFFSGEIGAFHLGGVDEGMVRDALGEFKGRPVVMRLNTPGGSVDTGLAIYNSLKAHRGGLTIIVELAASMGSLILQAADRRVMTPSGMVMLHAPWAVAAGDARELERRAAMLRKYGERLIPIYAARSGKSEEAIRAMFMEEHWFNAGEAVANGFADEIQTPKRFPKAVKARAKAFLAKCRFDEMVADYE